MKGAKRKSPQGLLLDPEKSVKVQVVQKFDREEASSNSNHTETEEHHRGRWTGKYDFLASLIAYAIGLGNVWRFPYLTYKHSGTFLIPYFTCWLIASTPIFFMEVSIGQFLGEGGISVWKLCPLFKGVGIANNIVASMCNIYYCVIVAWAMFYLVSTFTSTLLPWQTCWRSWNNNYCWDAAGNMSLAELAEKGISLNETQSPVTQFWEKRVLKTTTGIHDTGGLQWELVVLLALVWIMTYFALRKGITNSRKLVYICAITPYVLLLVLLVRGLTLEGAGEGLKFFLQPDAKKLLQAEVWKDAGTQIFYSSGIGFGTLVALGSYNDYHHNVHRDALILCGVNSVTSLTAGAVVFSVLGYMAVATGKTVSEVVKSGVGLAFLVYPEAISTLPISQLWSVLFFLMIMILGLDSQICTVEGVVLALCDQFPNVLRKNKQVFVAAMCAVGFLLGLPMVCRSGQYWLTLVDAYGASGITLLFVVFFEIVALSWGFGADRIFDGLEDMTGRRPWKFWYYSWRYTAPLVCTIIFIITIYDYTPLTYPDKVTPYPTWAMVLGFLMSLLSMLAVPVYAIYCLITTEGSSLSERLRRSIIPQVKLQFEKKEYSAVSPDER